MADLFQVLSPFVLIIIVLYGFAIMLGKTRELNKELKRVGAAIFQFVVRVFSSVVVFVFTKLKEIHNYLFSKNAVVTALVEIGIAILLVVLLICKK